MTLNYHTNSAAQVKNSIEAVLFSTDNIQNSANLLKDNELFIELRNDNFLKHHDAILDMARKKLSNAQYRFFEYMVRKSNNLTGHVYRSQEIIARDLGCGTRNVRKLLIAVEKHGFIQSMQQRYKECNHYYILFDKLKEVPDILHRCGTRADLPLCSPDNTTIRNSTFLHTTKKKKKKVSINTYKDNTNFLIEFEVKEEVQSEEPIELTPYWQAKQQTRENIRRKCGHYSYDHVDECEVSFRQIEISKGRKFKPDDWQRLFYKYCIDTYDNKQKFGSRWIPHLKRVGFNEQKQTNSLNNITFDDNISVVADYATTESDRDMKPYKRSADIRAEDSSVMVRKPKKYTPPPPTPDFKATWTEEEEREADLAMQNFYKKHHIPEPRKVIPDHIGGVDKMVAHDPQPTEAFSPEWFAWCDREVQREAAAKKTN